MDDKGDNVEKPFKTQPFLVLESVRNICDWCNVYYPAKHNFFLSAKARTDTGAQAATVNIRAKNSTTGDAGYVVTGLSTSARWTYMSAVYSAFGFEDGD